MKRISKTMIAGLLLLALPMAANAQTHLKSAFNNFIKAKGVTISKELSMTKDPETNKKTAQCDIYRFTMPKSSRHLIDNLTDAFEQDRDEAFTVAMGDGRKPTDGEKKWWEKYNTAQPAVMLAVGDGTTRSVGLGYEGSQYVYSLFLDPEDTDKLYRYAYGMEWTTGKDSISGKLVLTYAIRKEKRKSRISFNINDESFREQLGSLDSMLNDIIKIDITPEEKQQAEEAIKKARIKAEEAKRKVQTEQDKAIKHAKKEAAKAKAKARRAANE